MPGFKNRFPITKTLIGPWREIVDIVSDRLSSSERRLLVNAVRSAEDQAANLNERLEQIEAILKPTVDEGQPSAPALCNEVPRPVDSIGSSGLSERAMRCDAVIPGVGSITNATLARGALRFYGELVYQSGQNFYFTIANAYVCCETPTGAINSVNTTYALARTPEPATSLMLFKNGQLMSPAGVDYTLSGATITMVSAPFTGGNLRAWYWVRT